MITQSEICSTQNKTKNKKKTKNMNQIDDSSCVKPSSCEYSVNQSEAYLVTFKDLYIRRLSSDS